MRKISRTSGPTKKSQLYPVAEPVAQSIMYKSGKKSDGWHNKALLNIDNSAKKDTKYTLAIRHQPE